MSNRETRKRTATGHAEGQLDELTQEKLRQLVAKIERLEEEKKGLSDDIREVYAEAKALGFDTATIRAAIRARKKDPDEREAEQLTLDLYLDAIGD